MITTEVFQHRVLSTIKAIDRKQENEMRIKMDRIAPFNNVCKVNGGWEHANIEIEYIPNEKLLEVTSHRKFFTNEFNMFIEDIADQYFKALSQILNPKYLKVMVHLEDVTLTPWTVCIEG